MMGFFVVSKKVTEKNRIKNEVNPSINRINLN